jgi:hypothetical protein
METSRQEYIKGVAKNIVEQMGGEASEICTGNCTIFAMKLIDTIGEGQIVNSYLSDSMLSDIEGYDIINSSVGSKRYPHCYVKIENIFFDAFDYQGVDEEYCMEYLEKI